MAEQRRRYAFMLPAQQLAERRRMQQQTAELQARRSRAAAAFVELPKESPLRERIEDAITLAAEPVKR